MIVKFQFDTLAFSSWHVDLDNPIDISIPIQTDAHPRCFNAPSILLEPVRKAGFVGSIEEGSPVNFYNIFLNPHGTCTHTESSAHVFSNGINIGDVLCNGFFPAQLVSIAPVGSSEEQSIGLEGWRMIETSLCQGIKALIVRSLPNEFVKYNRDYSQTNPPYFQPEFIERIVNFGIEHLLVDLPSIDKESDGGVLSAHKTFWSSDLRKRIATVTELIFIDNSIEDGLYLLNINPLAIRLDVSPSRPILYKLLYSIADESKTGKI